MRAAVSVARVERASVQFVAAGSRCNASGGASSIQASPNRRPSSTRAALKQHASSARAAPEQRPSSTNQRALVPI
eukprot:1047850-Lingulodinium_polyedra.AAC.1